MKMRPARNGAPVRQERSKMPLPHSSDRESLPFSRNCKFCEEEIPEKRLRAVPDTHACVECLEFYGDIPPIRRFDGYVGDEQYSTYFTQNQDIEREIARFNGSEIRDEYYEAAVGDDSFDYRDTVGIIGGGRLPDVFQDDEDEPEAYQNVRKSGPWAAKRDAKAA